MPVDLTAERIGDWDWIVERLAEVEPLHPPGSHNAYLSYSFGWILGEVVRPDRSAATLVLPNS